MQQQKRQEKKLTLSEKTKESASKEIKKSEKKVIKYTNNSVSI